jgi:pyridoxal phosphate enzyme (YggS family)
MIQRRVEIATALAAVESRIERAAQFSGRSREDISLIVVTKTYPIEDIEILHDLGVFDFGENRENEGQAKSELVAGRWHFQGQVQGNKIASIGRWAHAVHSIDNVKHLSKFESSLPEGKVLSVFLQVSLDAMPGRGGASPSEIDRLAELTLASPRMKLLGIMAVAPVSEKPSTAFGRLAEIHSDFRYKFPSAQALSAGMSSDFEEAIAHGATHVRIGSSILGVRTTQR